MSGSVLHKSHNPPHPYFTEFALCFFELKLCVEHISVTAKDFFMKPYRYIYLNEWKCIAQKP